MHFGMAGVSCYLAMPTHRDIPAQTVIALLETQHLLQSKNIPLEVHLEVGGSLVHHSRIALAHRFLKSSATHLFWVDSDISWQCEDFMRLLALATKMEVVCAAYPTKREPGQFLMRYESEILRGNEYGCFPIKGIGLGFTVVQRKVIQELWDKAPKRKFPWSEELLPKVFRLDEEGIEDRGEDMAFFSDIRDLGYVVNLDPNVVLGHIGSKVYTGQLLSMMEKVA